VISYHNELKLFFIRYVSLKHVKEGPNTSKKYVRGHPKETNKKIRIHNCIDKLEKFN